MAASLDAAQREHEREYRPKLPGLDGRVAPTRWTSVRGRAIPVGRRQEAGGRHLWISFTPPEELLRVSTEPNSHAFIVVYVPRDMREGQELEARVASDDDLSALRRRALAQLGRDASLWRAMVVNAHSGQVVGVVTRAAPHWELPLMLTREAFAAH